MPTRKQRRRALKERRHDYEYETVWVDPVTGEEVDAPEDYVEEPPEKAVNGKPTAKRDGAKTKPTPKAAQQRGGRPVRVPPPPSWRRATKRALIFGVVIFAVFAILGSKNGHNNYAAALLLGGVYTVIFIPFTYYIDRFSHNRWQRRAGQQGQKGAAKKR
jgi:hypothetical protein